MNLSFFKDLVKLVYVFAHVFHVYQGDYLVQKRVVLGPLHQGAYCVQKRGLGLEL